FRPPSIVPRIGISALVTSGAAPAISAGGTLYFEARHNWFSFLVGGRYDLPASATVARGTVRSSVLLGSAGPCVHGGSFSGCVLAGVGRFVAQSEGIAHPREDKALHGIVGLQVGYEIAFGRAFVLKPYGQVDALLTPHVLQIDDVDVYS